MKTAALIQLTAFLALLATVGAAAVGSDSPAPRPLRQTKSDLLAGEFQGLCYSGFRHGQHPDRGDGAKNPTEEQILEGLSILGRHGHVPLLRLYDAKTNSEVVLKLIHKPRLKFKVMLGAGLAGEMNNPGCPWLKPISPEILQSNRTHTAAEIREAIRLANQYPNLVVAVAVGSEALVSWNDHLVTEDAMLHQVREVKRSVRQPVTVCDNYDWWAKRGQALAREVDFVSVHTYPLWENQDIDEAMPFTLANLEAVRKALPHSRLVITEAGWATVASEFGARASEARQKRQYQDLRQWARANHVITFFFGAFDEDWKGNRDDPKGAEEHWGFFTVDRRPKQVMR